MKIENDSWVYVMVQDPGSNEQFVGLEDKEAGTSFIPLFIEKEQALQCFLNIPRGAGKKYEAQAILFEELVEQSSPHGFRLYLLDGEGKIIEKM